ncbi:S41 family peptidase [Flavobacterium tegetincola]|uniref:S41 family peptidase n=1 Tax=Flavobacterium tegetincola TaxID=150172 RepID=UPI0004799C3F|nr:S41 family peptidase [Flavobacterium tegetincola]
MKQLFILLMFYTIVTSCTSVRKHNQLLNQPIAVSKLKYDIDFAYSNLKRLHPELYWYVSKEQLDYKFDSLKTTISEPLTSFEFYTKITPVINEVRQGHLGIYPNVKRFSKAETKALTKKGMGPFSQFDLMMFENKLYVEKNKSIDPTITVGSEVISIDSIPTVLLLNRYRKLITSDGYNNTFYKHHLPKRFSNLYVAEYGIKDSLLYEFKIKDSIKKIWIARKKIDESQNKAKDSIEKIVSKAEKKKILLVNKSKRRQQTIKGYDPMTKTFQRSLNFIEKDSSVAVLNIKSFSIGDYEPFYKQAFDRIKANKSQYLILDLRDNPGGRLSEINYIYSFVADSAIAFADKSEVVSKTSFLKRNYFNGNIGTKALQTIAYPFYVSYIFLKVKKENDKFYYKTSENKVKPLDENRFKGKMYVLIDGGSFSASSLLSSNLKGSKRAIFVGEETGGAFNGTVAGQMPIIVLPHSKIKMRVGLMKIAPHYKTDEKGYGIRPDIEMIPTLQDKINGIDPEMNWILENIKIENGNAK